jgi:hypothetical protein
MEHHQQQEVSALVYAAVSSFVAATIPFLTASAKVHLCCILPPLCPRPFYALHTISARYYFNFLS